MATVLQALSQLAEVAPRVRATGVWSWEDTDGLSQTVPEYGRGYALAGQTGARSGDRQCAWQAKPLPDGGAAAVGSQNTGSRPGSLRMRAYLE